jgi:hypothetical protein
MAANLSLYYRMTPQTLFIIILRVLGILSFKELVISIPQLITIVLSFFSGYSISDGLFMVLISLLAVALNLAVSYVLIFKADFLVTRLGLDHGIQESSLQLNISLPSILSIAIIVTGFLILVFEIPEFIRMIHARLQQQSIAFYQNESTNWSPVIASGVKILFGLLIIGERWRILKFLARPSDPVGKE